MVNIKYIKPNLINTWLDPRSELLIGLTQINPSIFVFQKNEQKVKMVSFLKKPLSQIVFW
jgi:hypothetical protein